jgi:microcompartment protein CcmL/EutN
MSNPEFTTKQNYVRTIEGRIASLNIYKEAGYEAEVQRMEFALADVIANMPEGELDALRAIQNKVLTPAEKAAESTRIAKQMEENRDKPSI